MQEISSFIKNLLSFRLGMAVPVVKSIGENVGQINKYNQHRIV